MGGVVEGALHLRGVVAQKVHGFANFGHGVAGALARFTHQQAQQGLHALFQQVGGAQQGGCALRGWRGGPGGCSGLGVRQGLVDVGRSGFLHLAHHVVVISGVAHGLGGACGHVSGQQGRCCPGLACCGLQRGGQLGQRVFVRQIQPARVAAVGAIQRCWQRNARVGQTGGAFLGCLLIHHLHGALHQLIQRNGFVGNAVHEGGVGAVFEQAAHQVGQQRFVRAHGGVDAAGAAQLASRDGAHHLLIQWLAHAVQALELVLPGVVVAARQMVDGGQCFSVVRGELGVHSLGRGQQLLGAGDVRNVGVHLAGVDGVVREAIHLGALDLAVPVRALHQAHHQAALGAASQVHHVVDDEGAALLVGLDDEANAVPAGQRGLVAQALQQVQRQLQPVGFFGVDVQANVVLLGQHRQAQHQRVQLVHHAAKLRTAVSRVQGRELDGDAGAFVDAAPGRGLANRVDGLLIRGVVALGVFAGQRCFAQHVVRIAEALGLHRAGVAQGFVDGFAGHKLLAHHAHGDLNALADQRLAALGRKAAERAPQAAFAVRGHQLAGNQQAPGGGVDEERGALAQVRIPLAVADLVADERVARGFVGNAQQCLGQAHQRHAFLG